jgi:hypothetical protein
MSLGSSKKIRKDWNWKEYISSCLCWRYWWTHTHTHIYIIYKNTEALLEASREDDIDVNTEKTKYEFISRRDSSVGIALGYGLDDRGSRVRFPAEAGNFSSHHRVQNGSGATQPPIQCVAAAISLGVKRPGREANHSLPSSIEVKEWVELYLDSPKTSSWRGARLKKAHGEL